MTSKNDKVYHEDQMRFLWTLNYEPDLEQHQVSEKEVRELTLQLKLDPALKSIFESRPPVRIKKFLVNPSPPSHQTLQFPMKLKQMTDDETREYHRKKLYELSLKSIGEIPQLEEPTYDQKVWVLNRLKQSNQYWRSWGK